MGRIDKAQIRREAQDEAVQAEQQETRILLRLRTWKLGTFWVGIALAAAIVSVIPFLRDFPLHDEWDLVGRKILLLSMCLLAVFMYVAGTTYNFWAYLRDVRKTNGKFAPPRDPHRRG